MGKEIKLILRLIACFFLVTQSAFARQSNNVSMTGGKSLHISCNKSIRNLKTNEIECTGNVYVRRPGDLLTADYIKMNMNTEDLHAAGNVVYFTGTTVFYGRQMDFNFTTDTGIIQDGRIENDKYELLGEYIEKYSEDEYYLRDADYTTCRDCPPSWRLAAKTVDFKVEGYAMMGNVYIKVNESPTLYLPGLIIPVKTQRQTGFLFPKFGTNQTNGFMFVQPFYWAISRSTDLTVGLGTYTTRGRKAEAEFRFAAKERSTGEFKGYHLKDGIYDPGVTNRWGVNYSHGLLFPYRIEQKLQILDSSDRDYARTFTSDIPGYGEPALVSRAGISRAGRDASVWIDARRIRNTMTTKRVGFDGSTVQELPKVGVATVDHRVSDDIPLHWGLSAHYSKFWRQESSFDAIYKDEPPTTLRNDFIPGETPLRRGDRYTVIPELYYTARMWEVLEVVPSVQYRSFFYKFDTPLAPTTIRGYLLNQVDFATTFEKVLRPDLKHKMRPSVTYSIIPSVQNNSNHPFVKQLETSGNQFDEHDVIPLTNQNQIYFVPLGNSITYQLNNKFILKSDEAPYTYTKSVEVMSGQSFNIYEYRRSKDERKPFSRFFTFVNVNTKRIQGSFEYYFYPYVNGSTYNLGVNYIFAQYQRRLLLFQRSVGLSYSYNQITARSNNPGANVTWSFNDYLMAQAGGVYQLPMYINSGVVTARMLSLNGSVIFQSRSQCYRIVGMYTRVLGRGWDVSFNVPVNLSGDSFSNVVGSGSEGGSGILGQSPI